MEPSANRSYRLQKGVRVRRESFGLLFYCRDGPRLTFVHSGPWIRPEFFSGRFTLKDWLRDGNPSGEKVSGLEAKVSRALSRLVDKGLIIETVEDS